MDDETVGGVRPSFWVIGGYYVFVASLLGVTVTIIIALLGVLAGCRDRSGGTQAPSPTNDLLRAQSVALEQRDFEPSGLHTQVFFAAGDSHGPIVLGPKRRCLDCRKDTPMNHPDGCMWCASAQPGDTASEGPPAR